MKLKDIGKIVTGKTPSTKQLENFSELDDKYLFVTPRDMKDNCKYIESTERYLTSFVEDKFKSQIIKKDSVCISCIGSDMGKVYMINRLGITNQQINSITDIKDICNPHYLYYYFSDKKEYLKGIASGSTMPILNKSTFENIEIDLPARNIQDKIVKILNNIDNKIELNNQTNDNLYEITNKLYEQLFVIERQDDWKEYNIQELMDISNGYSYTGKELVDTSVVGMATIKNFERTGGFKEEGFKDIEPIRAKDIHYADKFDILVACTDLTQNADIIGNAIMLLNIGKYEKVVISMDLVKILPKKNKYLVFSILNSKEFKNFALGYKTGTTVLHLNKNCFKDFHIKVPDFDKIENFEKVVETNYKKISYNLEENNTLTQLRDNLLPKLMNGEIDLDKIEI